MGTSLNKTQSLYLKNNSGQTVTKGDTVIIDRSLASSFTLTGSSGYTLTQIGVVLDQTNVANGTSCLVAVGGYVPVINLISGSNVGDTFGLSSVVKKAIPHANILAGDFGQVLSAGTTPDANLWGDIERRGEFVGCAYGLNTGSVPTNTVYYPLNWVKDFDTHNAFQTGSSSTVIANANRFTAPISGYYDINFNVRFFNSSWTLASTCQIFCYINGIAGSDYHQFGEFVAQSANSFEIQCGGSKTVFLNKGDFINFVIFQVSGSTKVIQGNGHNNGGDSYFSIIKVG